MENLAAIFAQKRAEKKEEMRAEMLSTCEAALANWDGKVDCSKEFRVRYSARKWLNYFSEKEIIQILDAFCEENGCDRVSYTYFFEEGGEFVFN